MVRVILTCLAVVALAAFAAAQLPPYWEKDIEAYHFHTYFFEENARHLTEALDLRRAIRAKIQEGFIPDCSLNMLEPGVDGPHPFGQYELCCNKTSFPSAMAWFMQNHGNLSVLVHPLTTEDLADHEERATWIGQAVPLDTECPCLYPVLPKPRPCPVYPEYPDELIPGWQSPWPKIPGTEDYKNASKIDLRFVKY